MTAISKLSIAAVLAFASAASAVAQESGHGSHAGHGATVAQAAHAEHAGHKVGVLGEMVDGEIKKVDKEAGKITIRHGELKALKMPAMTMAFRTKDPAMLDQVKVGDKVKFMAEKVNGALTVVHLVSAK